MTVDSDRSFTSILGEIANRVERIVRAEVNLAKLELRDEVRRLQRAALLLAAGAVVAILAIVFALLASVYALSTVMTPSAAALLVAAITAVIALVCIFAGRRRLGRVTLPRTAASIQSLQSLQEGLQWTKSSAH